MKKTFHPRGEGVQEAAFFLCRKRNVCLLCQNWPWDVIWGSSNTLKRNACTAYVIYLSYTSGLKIAIKILLFACFFVTRQWKFSAFTLTLPQFCICIYCKALKRQPRIHHYQFSMSKISLFLSFACR